MLRFCRVLNKLTLPVFLIASFSGVAQTPGIRLTKSLESSPRVSLAHSRTPRVRTAEDLGPVPADTHISGVTLVFRRSAAQEADLQQLLSHLQDPNSPLYHQWLTPGAFA